MPLIEVNGEQLMLCANCGNIWDGYAQCYCWQWADAERDAEVDAELMPVLVPVLVPDVDAELMPELVPAAEAELWDAEDDGRVYIEIADDDDDDAAEVDAEADDEDDGRVYIEIEDEDEERLL